MLSKPTPAQLRTCDTLSQWPKWGEVSDIIDAELKAIFERMIGASAEADLHSLRGRAQALKEFQTLVREAPAQLAKAGVRPAL